MGVDIPNLIETVSRGNEDMRNLLYAFYNQDTLLNKATGNSQVDPVNSTQQPSTTPPVAGIISVSGANGAYQVNITNAAQGGVNAALYNQYRYSPIKSFGQTVTTSEPSTATTATVPYPGQTLYFQARWSFDRVNWSSWVLAATTPISSNLQSSAASENNTPLNQSNYAYVDSVAAGGVANVRVYGAAGPYNGYTSVKGGVETARPSATIVNVALNSTQLVAYDGEAFPVKSTLPGVFPDTWEPVGQVNVVGSGTPTLPVIVLLVQSGYVVGIKSSSTFGAGLTQLPTFTITDSSGAGAAIVATGLSGGAITGIQVTNAGNGSYSSTPSVTAHGGVFSGNTGGGTASGGNGGRLTKI